MNKINVYCENKGWLFEDLKNQIASMGAIATERPLKKAAAWICIRTIEAKRTPNKAKTLVQVHDCDSRPLEGYGCISFVHPAARESWGKSFKFTYDITPIGTRDVPVSELPEAPTIGFFCREVSGKKRSKMFRQAVILAREKGAIFDVLMIGQRLGPIDDIGKLEDRGAIPVDYARIDALVTCSVSPMVPLSAYEAVAAGRTVITTPREWPKGKWPMVKTGETAEDIADLIIETIKERNLHAPYRPFTRKAWAKRQLYLACGLAQK